MTIINDILDLSKIEAGGMEIEYGPVNVHTILEDMANMFSLKLSQKGLEFKTEIDSNLPDILILDGIRLRQILLNLVGNAIKFTER